jgi:hypothetical protein
MSALIVGCFSPDFAYFFFFGTHGRFAHTFKGAFLLDLPLSLIAYLLFHAFIKQPFSMLLPWGFRARIKPEAMGFSFWPLSRVALIVASILIGIGTHIFWDSFTHPFYWPYRHLSFLSDPGYFPIEGQVEMYKALQNFSSVFGLVIVALWIALWYRSGKPRELPVAKPYSPWQTRVITFVAPALALMGALLVAYENDGIPEFEFRSMLHFWLTAGIATTTFLMVGLLLCGAVFRASGGGIRGETGD